MSALQPEYLAAGYADERVCSILLLLQDNNERTTGEENLQAIYKVDRAPSDTALRAVLEEMPVEKMGGGQYAPNYPLTGRYPVQHQNVGMS